MASKKELIANMGVEMVHFDLSDQPEHQQIIPLGLYLHETDVSDNERALARTLSAVTADH